MKTIIEIYQENGAWIVKYNENGEIKLSEPLPTHDTAVSVSELILNT